MSISTSVWPRRVGLLLVVLGLAWWGFTALRAEPEAGKAEVPASE